MFESEDLYYDYPSKLNKYYPKPDSKEAVDRKNRFEQHYELVHAALGLTCEAGEVADLIKKFVAYDKEVDRDDVVDELGDLMHCVARICEFYNIDLKEILEGNLKKLDFRFKDGYNDNRAITKGELK